MGGAALEGLVDDPEDAVPLFESGTAVSLEPCHHRSAVGPMAGVVTPSMWMFVLEDPKSGHRTYCSLNEGLGKVLRYGAYSPEVLTRLRWMGDVLGPLLQKAVRDRPGRSTSTGILTQMLQMGDEAHNRNRAGTLMLLRDLSPAMVTSGTDPADVAEALRFIGGNDHFFLNLAMPACKLALDAARDIEGSTMVVAMARNGTDFGIQVSGTGDEWFTGPAQLADGLFLGDYGPDDANPDIGDSAITETAGIGGFAMATAPAIVRFVGGTVPDALATTRRMHEITLGENPRWSVPVLEFQGVPSGHRRHPGLPDRHPAADQHRHGRQGRRRRPGRRRAGHAAGRDLPAGARRARRPRPRPNLSPRTQRRLSHRSLGGVRRCRVNGHMTRYADPTRCPDCRAALPPTPEQLPRPARSRCRDPLIHELFRTLEHADSLLVLRPRRRPQSRAPALPTPADPRTPRPSPAADSARRRFPRSCSGLGALCLLVAAITFLALAWALMGIGGRTLVLVGLTATAGVLGTWLARRGLGSPPSH